MCVCAVCMCVHACDQVCCTRAVKCMHTLSALVGVCVCIYRQPKLYDVYIVHLWVQLGGVHV